MSRHRAPRTRHSRSAVAAAALGVGALTQALSPATAQAEPAGHEADGNGLGLPDVGVHHAGTRTVGVHGLGAARHRHPGTYRLMSSGERQYRNGCRLGYITDDCEQFSVTNLLQRGIDPYL